MKTGFITAVLALIIPVLLTAVVLPNMPEYAPQIFSASIILSYVAAVGAGVLAYGAYLRYVAK